jgi:hypothetical protein
MIMEPEFTLLLIIFLMVVIVSAYYGYLVNKLFIQMKGEDEPNFTYFGSPSKGEIYSIYGNPFYLGENVMFHPKEHKKFNEFLILSSHEGKYQQIVVKILKTKKILLTMNIVLGLTFITIIVLSWWA